MIPFSPLQVAPEVAGVLDVGLVLVRLGMRRPHAQVPSARSARPAKSPRRRSGASDSAHGDAILRRGPSALGRPVRRARRCTRDGCDEVLGRAPHGLADISGPGRFGSEMTLETQEVGAATVRVARRSEHVVLVTAPARERGARLRRLHDLLSIRCGSIDVHELRHGTAVRTVPRGGPGAVRLVVWSHRFDTLQTQLTGPTSPAVVEPARCPIAIVHPPYRQRADRWATAALAGAR